MVHNTLCLNHGAICDQKKKRTQNSLFLRTARKNKKSLGEVVAENRYGLMILLCKTSAFDSAWSNKYKEPSMHNKFVTGICNIVDILCSYNFLLGAE